MYERLSPRTSSDDSVVCIACGEEVQREDAREYDKHGDRWDREGKHFEYLCKPCYRETSRAPRQGLEAKLVEARAGEVSDEAFFRTFLTNARE